MVRNVLVTADLRYLGGERDRLLGLRVAVRTGGRAQVKVEEGRLRRALPWLLSGLSLAMLAASAALAVITRPSGEPGETWLGMVVASLLTVPVPIVGAIIARGDPRSAYGWVWVAMGLAASALNLSGAALEAAAASPLVSPEAVAALGAVAWPLAFGLFPYVMLLYPDGRPPSRRWRILVWTVGAALVLSVSLVLMVPGEFPTASVDNPYAASGALGDLATAVVTVSVVVFLAANIPALASLFVRYRSAGRQERLQLKWFGFAGVMFVVMFIVDAAWDAHGVVEALKEGLPIALLPVAIGIAITKHRLYEIDRIVSRTVTYGVVIAVLAAVYLTGVTLMTTVFPFDSELAVAASTLAAAALFNPIRAQVHRRVRRRFDRAHYDAEKVVDEFVTRLRSDPDPRSLASDWVGVVEYTLRPRRLGVWMRTGR